jgi:hypothetical protein
LVHTGSQILSSKSLEVNPSNLNHWEHGNWDLPLHIRSWVLRSKYDMDAYMATLFGGETWDWCWESWAKQKARPNSQHNSCEYFCINFSFGKMYSQDWKLNLLILQANLALGSTNFIGIIHQVHYIDSQFNLNLWPFQSMLWIFHEQFNFISQRTVQLV